MYNMGSINWWKYVDTEYLTLFPFEQARPMRRCESIFETATGNFIVKSNLRKNKTNADAKKYY